MQPVSPTAKSYDSGTIWFHWLTAAAIVGQWVGAETLDYWPKWLQLHLVSLHITFGITIGLLVLARLFWRATGGRQLPPADKGALHVLAKATHWGLYLLVLTVVALGVTMLAIHSFSYFNLFQLPSLNTGDRALFGRVHGIHELLATTILVVALFHAAAALLHQYVWRDGVLGRMVPGLR